MPNGGDGYDPRAIWEMVRDLQNDLVKRADEITELRNRVKDLEADKEALLVTIKLLPEPLETHQGCLGHNDKEGD